MYSLSGSSLVILVVNACLAILVVSVLRILVEQEYCSVTEHHCLRVRKRLLMPYENISKDLWFKLTKVAESKISAQWATAVPAEVRPWLKAKTGDMLEWHVIDEHVEVKKK